MNNPSESPTNIKINLPDAKFKALSESCGSSGRLYMLCQAFWCVKTCHKFTDPLPLPPIIPSEVWCNQRCLSCTKQNWTLNPKNSSLCRAHSQAQSEAQAQYQKNWLQAQPKPWLGEPSAPLDIIHERFLKEPLLWFVQFHLLTVITPIIR